MKVDTVYQRYTIGPAKIPRNAEYPLTVEVTVTDTVSRGDALPGRAGLQYRSEQGEDTFYSFQITQLGEVFLEKGTAKRYYRLYTDKPREVRVGQTNKLGLIGKDNTLYLYENDSLVKTIEDASVQGGETGLIVSNVGRFCFDNL